jgi:hypothetical protein
MNENNEFEDRNSDLLTKEFQYTSNPDFTFVKAHSRSDRDVPEDIGAIVSLRNTWDKTDVNYFTSTLEHEDFAKMFLSAFCSLSPEALSALKECYDDEELQGLMNAFQAHKSGTPIVMLICKGACFSKKNNILPIKYIAKITGSPVMGPNVDIDPVYCRDTYTADPNTQKIQEADENQDMDYSKIEIFLDVNPKTLKDVDPMWVVYFPDGTSTNIKAPRLSVALKEFKKICGEHGSKTLSREKKEDSQIPQNSSPKSAPTSKQSPGND